MSYQQQTARQRQPQQQSGQMVRRDQTGLDRVAGSYRHPDKVRRRLELCAQQAHLVAPATSCGELPDGTAVALSPPRAGGAERPREELPRALALCRAQAQLTAAPW